MRRGQLTYCCPGRCPNADRGFLLGDVVRRLFIVVMLLVTTLAFAEWRHIEKEDLMDGTVSKTAILWATASTGTLTDPALVIRESPVGYDVYVSWGGYNLDRDTSSVHYRIGDDRGTWKAGLSTDHEATFLVDSHRVISALLDAEGEEFVIQVRRATGVRSVAMFDLTGITDAWLVLDADD